MRFLGKCNAAYGAVVTVLVAILGPYWYISTGYLLCNVLDWLTDWYKARKLGRESSKTGSGGILKRPGYWVIILVSLLMPKLFIGLGHDILGLNLDFLLLLGWFTLTCLLINEIRSILENLVECGYDVPAFLIKGLAVTEKLINAETEKVNREREGKIMVVLEGHAGKKTEEQRRNDAAQKARPKGIQDTTYVTTGPTTGKANEHDDNPAPSVQEEIPVIVVPSKPAGGITDDAGNGPEVER